MGEPGEPLPEPFLPGGYVDEALWGCPYYQQGWREGDEAGRQAGQALRDTLEAQRKNTFLRDTDGTDTPERRRAIGWTDAAGVSKYALQLYAERMALTESP